MLFTEIFYNLLWIVKQRHVKEAPQKKENPKKRNP